MNEIVFTTRFEAVSNSSVHLCDVKILSQVINTFNNMLKSIIGLYNLKAETDLRACTQMIEAKNESICFIASVKSEKDLSIDGFPSFLDNAISTLSKNNNVNSTTDFSFLNSYMPSLLKAKISTIRFDPNNVQEKCRTVKLPIINTDFHDECLYNNIQEGLKHIICIIEQFRNKIGEKGNAPISYNNPKYVFRGITRFYNDDGIASEEKSIELEEINVQNDYIKSSLAVRLRDTSKEFIKNSNYTRTYYVNALEDIIRKAKNMYPNKYPSEMSDLDILADIQHNGGATCLVDFSKNILTSIWFACNADPQSNGYVYCYNYMDDMIKNDALTFIRPEDENRKISELLSQTYRETNVCSDVETRFCLWEPSKRNNRITRQDSVFVFGIEKFKVSKHSITVIGIPAEWKSSILTAMKSIFNISGNSVYNDPIGFASNLNKLRPYRKMLDTVYTRGYTNMVKGHYSSALDFLKLAEIEYLKLSDTSQNNNWDDSKLMELHFSLAVCYKNLSRQNEKIHYLENANLEYKKVIHLAKKLLIINEKQKLSIDSQYEDYYKHKIVRAYNARVTLMYKLQRYKDAIEICREIIDTIKEWGKASTNSNKQLTSTYCEISILELNDLDLIQQCKRNKDKIDQVEKKDEARDENEGDHQPTNDFSFFDLLTEYYNEVKKVIQTEQYDDEMICYKIVRWNKKAEKYFEHVKTKDKPVDGRQNEDKKEYILWNFSDIKNAIDAIEESDCLYNKKTLLQDLTAGVISLRDLYEMQGWWSNDEV